MKRKSKIKNTPVVLVTGTLAEPAVRAVAAALKESGVEAQVVVLNIQVAALMTTEWVARKLSLPAGCKAERVLLPGYCRGEVDAIAGKLGMKVEKGPKEIADLPQWLRGGGALLARDRPDYGSYDIEIIAEINHVPGLPLEEVIAQAEMLVADGADVIDIGLDPQGDRYPWPGVAEVVRELRARKMRVSVDSFQREEVGAACAAGAELVLSVNSTNRDAAADWGAEVVVVPDTPQDMKSLDRTVAYLEKKKVRYRIDAVLEPLGLGFAASLGRYIEVRRRYPKTAMMMGVGNVTELTDVDSAGVNAVLAGFCQELNIRSVLTTQVINWARSSVRELDIARRMMRHAISNRLPPKNADDRLVMLRDPRLRPVDPERLKRMAERLTDANVRIFADTKRGRIHAMKKGVHASGDDPFLIFDELGIDDASHAFYLGYEMAKALTAITLGKNYQQDEALRWGMLTREERSHFERRKRGKAEKQKSRKAENGKGGNDGEL